MLITAIDPGPEESAFVVYDTTFHTPHQRGIVGNDNMRRRIQNYNLLTVIEMIGCYGMPVGKDIFDTCVWIGRFVECSTCNFSLIYRKDVKLYLCNSARAKDSNIRQVLIDRYGGSKASAIGNKKIGEGPLYGFKKDMWSALAVAVYFSDHLEENKEKPTMQQRVHANFEAVRAGKKRRELVL